MMRVHGTHTYHNTNVHGKYLEPQKVGINVRMRQQCVPGSPFPPPTRAWVRGYIYTIPYMVRED